MGNSVGLAALNLMQEKSRYIKILTLLLLLRQGWVGGGTKIRKFRKKVRINLQETVEA